MSTSTESIAITLVSALAASLGAAGLKAGANKSVHAARGLVGVEIAGGLFLYVLSTLLFISALKTGALSVLYPLASVSNLLTVIWSRMFFGESLTAPKFAGIGLIMAGVACLAIFR